MLMLLFLEAHLEIHCVRNNTHPSPETEPASRRTAKAESGPGTQGAHTSQGFRVRSGGERGKLGANIFHGEEVQQESGNPRS